MRVHLKIIFLCLEKCLILDASIMLGWLWENDVFIFFTFDKIKSRPISKNLIFLYQNKVKVSHML